MTETQRTPGQATCEDHDRSLFGDSADPEIWQTRDDRERTAWEAGAQGAITAALPAIRHFADTWRELMTSMPDRYQCIYNCAEANAAADLYRALGDDSTAEAIIAAHAEYDEEDDEHYQHARGTR